MSRLDIGQFVTPQNKAPIPIAAKSGVLKCISEPMTAPKVAPIKRVGTISPPLYPQDSVRVVKTIFKTNAKVGTAAPAKQAVIVDVPILL